jgi:hypothetical protein
VAEETAGPDEDARIIKADQLSNIGLDDWALKELAKAGEKARDSPKVNLAIAKIYRSDDDNVRALNTLRRSFPDYSQMKPEEMTREQWDVFYPLNYWDIIVQESKARISIHIRLPVDSPGNDLQRARVRCECLRTDAGAGADRKANGAKVWCQS